MKFSIGDKVLLRQTGDEAEVVAKLKGDMWEVMIDGLQFPVYEDEMEHPYLKWFTEKKPAPVKKAAPPEVPATEKPAAARPSLPEGIYLSFFPEYADAHSDDIRELKIYLFNEHPSVIRFDYRWKTAGGAGFAHQGELQPFSHLFLHSFPLEALNDRPEFQAELTNMSKLRKAKPVQQSYRPKAARLFAALHALQHDGKSMFHHLLTEQFPEAETTGGEPLPLVMPRMRGKAQPLRTLRELPRYEIDLHIEQIDPAAAGLDPGSILELQMGYLHRQLYLAMQHRMEQVVVIHGLGKGVLKKAVHDLLEELPAVSHFTHEWQGSYGFGATRVFFKYD